MPNTPTDVLLAANLPAQPGSLWALLAQIAWADPDLVRFTALHFTANVVGGGDPVSSDPVTGVAKAFFFVQTITGHVEQDPGAATPEDYAAQDVTYQIRDEDRNLDIWDSSIAMSDLVGVGNPPRPTPIDCRQAPLVLLPKGTFVVTFSPNADFPSAAHSVTGDAFRKVKITMYGCLVAETLADKLLDMNRKALTESGLIGSRVKA